MEKKRENVGIFLFYKYPIIFFIRLLFLVNYACNAMLCFIFEIKLLKLNTVLFSNNKFTMFTLKHTYKVKKNFKKKIMNNNRHCPTDGVVKKQLLFKVAITCHCSCFCLALLQHVELLLWQIIVYLTLLVSRCTRLWETCFIILPDCQFELLTIWILVLGWQFSNMLSIVINKMSTAFLLFTMCMS